MQTVFLVAMKDELENIFDMSLYNEQKEFGFTFFENGQEDRVIVQTGIGKSNAAAGAQFTLQMFPNAQYINTGLVGSFNNSLKIGEPVQVNKCRFFDVDVTAFNYVLGQIPQCEVYEYQLGKYPISEKIDNLRTTFLISGDTFTSAPEIRQKLEFHFHPDIVDMELASISHIFHLHKKLDKLSSIKAISDYVNESSNQDFKTNMKIACQNLKEFFAYGK